MTRDQKQHRLQEINERRAQVIHAALSILHGPSRVSDVDSDKRRKLRDLENATQKLDTEFDGLRAEPEV
jgi:hypothetical protein